MSDDKTRVLPGGEEKKLDTQPMLEAILERLSALSQGMAELRSEVAGMRAEMQQGFQLLTKKIELLTQDVLQVRAENRLLDERLGKLEQKPS